MIRVAPFAHLMRHAFEIEALGRAALEINPLYHPAALAAHIASARLGEQCLLVLAHGNDDVLHGFLPVIQPRPGEGGWLGMGHGVDLFAAGAPLADRDNPDVVSALAEGCRILGGATLGPVPNKGALREALAGAGAATDTARPVADLPMLDANRRLKIDEVSRKRAREDARAAAKAITKAHGPLKMVAGQTGMACESAIECLDALGWQGPLPMFRALVRSQEDDGIIRAFTMTSGGRTIAAAVGLMVEGQLDITGFAADPLLERDEVALVFADRMTSAVRADGELKQVVCRTPLLDAACRALWTAAEAQVRLAAHPRLTQQVRRLVTRLVPMRPVTAV